MSVLELSGGRHEVALEVHGAPNEQGEVQANSGSCPKPRDWSEWVIFPTALFSLSAGIVGAVSDTVDPENNGEFFTVSCFVISGVLFLAEYKVRQLWVKKSLDEETRNFEGENRDLTGRVSQLEGLLEERSGDVSKLQSDVERYQEENTRLIQQTDRLGRETGDLQRVVEELPKRRSDLAHESHDVAVTVDRIQKEEKDGGADLAGLDAIEKNLAALNQQRRDEAERHQQVMGESTPY